MEGAGWGADGVGVEAEGGVWCSGCGCGRGRGGVESCGEGVGGLDGAGAGAGDEARACGRGGEKEFGVSGCVCGIDMADEDGRVGAVVWTRRAAVRPGDERSGGSGQEVW